MQRGVDPACGEGGDRSRGVSQEQDSTPREGRHQTADRDQTASVSDGAGPARVEHRRDVLRECPQVRSLREPRREADLGNPDPGDRPAEVAGCAAPVEKAVQGVGLAQVEALELDLGADEEGAVAAEAKGSRHRAARPVGADQPTTAQSVPRQDHGGLGGGPVRAQGLAVAQLHARLARLLGDVPHPSGSVGREEEVVRRPQHSRPEIRCVEHHPAHLAEQGGGERQRLGGLANEDAGGVNGLAGCPFALEDHDVEAPAGQGRRTGETGEPCPRDDDVRAPHSGGSS